jgi:hypothetical protein
MARNLERRRVRNLDFLRPRVRGEFLFAGEEKLYVRGATYGPFRPNKSGSEYHSPEAVERDFAQTAANGLNTPGMRCRYGRDPWHDPETERG